MNDSLQLYTDGGCALKNPSPYGISWAFCVVELLPNTGTPAMLHQEAGALTTEICGKYPATNNLAEAIAAIKGLEYCNRVFPEDNVTWFSDSQLTINRLLLDYSMDKLPNNVRNRAIAVVKAFFDRTLEGIPVGSHPTKKELAAGVNKKGLPVSEFNVLVDKLAKLECKKLLLGKGD